MIIASVVLSIIFAVALAGSAISKFRKAPMQLELMQIVGFPVERMWVLGALELAAAVGLAIGIAWWPIGLAAAIGAALYFLGAIIAHVRVRNTRVQPSAVLLLVAVATLVLILLSH